MSTVRQQINLYQPTGEARLGEQLPFAADTAVLFAGAACACLLAVWGFGVWRTEHLERALQTLRREQQQQTETMASLQAARATGLSAAQLDATVEALTAELDMHSRALELLKQGGAGQTSGFSDRLTALARQHVEGLWLDHVVLSGLNGAMSIGGSALDPALVPRYLHGLAAEGALSGVRFDGFAIERFGSSASQEPAKATAPERRRFSFRAESTSLKTSGADQHP